MMGTPLGAQQRWLHSMYNTTHGGRRSVGHDVESDVCIANALANLKQEGTL